MPPLGVRCQGRRLLEEVRWVGKMCAALGRTCWGMWPLNLSYTVWMWRLLMEVRYVWRTALTGGDGEPVVQEAIGGLNVAASGCEISPSADLPLEMVCSVRLRSTIPAQRKKHFRGVSFRRGKICSWDCQG